MTINSNRLKTWIDNTYNNIGTWHNIGKDYWEWDNDETITNYPDNLLYLINKLTYHNYILWHLENICRAGDLHNVATAKLKIDIHNQARNDTIEQIDDLLIKLVQDNNTQAPYHSETLGSLIDRIIVTQLKIYHLCEINPTTELYKTRHSILNDQYNFLRNCATELLDDILNNKRHIRIFRQLKTYNNPELNPLITK